MSLKGNTMTTTEAMKYLKPGAIVPVDVQTTALLVNALREALASQGEALASEAIEQPAQQWQSTADKCELQKVPANGSLLPAQRTWVGLTDEERHACTQSPFTTENFWAIEAKLKEKNSG